MQLFLSWSGDLSREIAGILHKWIPSVLQSVEPFLSADDIDKGERWSDQIASKLRDSGFGVIVLTSDNLLAPWILFEAGALSKMVGQTNVAPLLTNVQVTQVRAPLTQFQATKFERNDVFKLLKSINKCCKAPVREEVLERTFEALWSQLESDIKAEIDRHSAMVPQKQKTADIDSLNASMSDLIESVQSLREDVRRNSPSRPIIPAVARDMRRVASIITNNKDADGDIVIVAEDAEIIESLSSKLAEYLESRSGTAKNALLKLSSPDSVDHGKSKD